MIQPAVAASVAAVFDNLLSVGICVVPSLADDQIMPPKCWYRHIQKLIVSEIFMGGLMSAGVACPDVLSLMGCGPGLARVWRSW